MIQIFNIVDDKVVINKLNLKYIEGSVVHAGSLDIVGKTTVGNDLDVAGTLTTHTLKVKNLITEAGSAGEIGQWKANTEDELNGKGFNWTWGNGSTQIIYRKGNRLWTNATLDISAQSSYNIDNVPVLSLSALGPTVTSSNLTKIGTLGSLNVANDASIGGFTWFNSTYGRVGIGNEDPQLAVDIIENNVNITIGSPDTNLATIGTRSNHDLAIVTDNINRILIKNNGEVQIGDPVGKNGILRVNGSLYVDNLVSDTRVDRVSPLQFQATNSRNIFGLGLLWSGTGTTRQFIMRDGPDRLWSSESIDLAEDKSYSINGQTVISANGLGPNVVRSNLISVGTLETLTVLGDTSLGNLTVGNNLNVKALSLNGLTVNSTGINSNASVKIVAQQTNIISGDQRSIEIGSVANTKNPVKVFGQLSVGINNPDTSVNFSVNGDIKVADRRFTNGTTAPASGQYELGDICWNTMPQLGSYIGWVCVSAGTPGQWLPFGSINTQ